MIEEFVMVDDESKKGVECKHVVKKEVKFADKKEEKRVVSDVKKEKKRVKFEDCKHNSMIFNGKRLFLEDSFIVDYKHIDGVRLKEYYCTICKIKTFTLGGQKMHWEKTHMPGRRVKSVKYAVLYEYFRNMSYRCYIEVKRPPFHSDKIVMNSYPSFYECEYCEQQFSTKNGIRTHCAEHEKQ